MEKYIRDNLSERITISDLAAHADKSVSFITHVFKEEFGLSPKQFVLNEKLEASRRRLSGGNTVRETAFSLGFYDEFHFSKAFKKRYGMSPSRYRES